MFFAVAVAMVSDGGYDRKIKTRSRSVSYYPGHRTRTARKWNRYKVEHTKTNEYPEHNQWNRYETNTWSNEYYSEHTKTVTKKNRYAHEKGRTYPVHPPHKEMTIKYSNYDGYNNVPHSSRKNAYSNY